jgi:hypothetical protein
MPGALNLIGQHFGLLTVLERVFPNNSNRNTRWRCSCACGKEVIVVGVDLRSGNTRSCGGPGCKKLGKEALDLTGQRFGRLVAIERIYPNSSTNKVRWLCLCDCGNKVIVETGSLKSGNTRSCGCLQVDVTIERNKKGLTLVDLTNQRFGRWTVIKRVNKYKKHDSFWLCKCDCGNEKIVSARILKCGDSSSCGCYSDEVRRLKKTHGLGDSPVYFVHRNMLERCFNPEHEAYKNYGGRGITICDEWLSLTIFHAWATKSGYKKGLTLDRIDNNGNYEPDNCRWATPTEQGNNKRDNVFITLNGESRTIAEWVRLLNIPRHVINARIKKGKSPEEILAPYTKKVRYFKTKKEI